LRDLPRLLVNAFQTSATVMLVIGATGALAWLITAEQVAVQLAAWIKLVASEPWVFLLLVNVALLLLGIFIEPLPALLLTAPLLLPLPSATAAMASGKLAPQSIVPGRMAQQQRTRSS